MKKIDKRKSYLIVFDCEACPLDRNIQDVDPYNMWAYDYGWAIIDKKGNVYRTRSFVNADIFLNEKIAMNSAYYSTKIPQYWNEIKNGTRTLTSHYNIVKTLYEDVEEFNVKKIFGHNFRFDVGATNNTTRWLTKSKYRYFFPKDVELHDSLKMSRQVIATMPTYKRFCIENGYLTKNNQPRLTAEILYRFITRNEEFAESHTGLEDVLIEKDIVVYCFNKHKKMNGKMW